MSDILERAKAKLAEGYTAINESVVRELITEVERLRSLQDTDILCQKINSDAEYIEQLKKRIDDTVIVANHRYADLQHICDDQAQEIATKDARIKELEAKAALKS